MDISSVPFRRCDCRVLLEVGRARLYGSSGSLRGSNRLRPHCFPAGAFYNGFPQASVFIKMRLKLSLRHPVSYTCTSFDSPSMLGMGCANNRVEWHLHLDNPRPPPSQVVPRFSLANAP